ncbi:MAG: DUF3822 family protein [Bacteroidia bacterium]
MSAPRPLTPQDIYTSSAFNPTSLSIYNLGVYTEADYLLYAISNVQHELLFLRLYKNRDGLEVSQFVEQVWQQDEFLRKRHGNVLWLTDSDKWMVVPAEFVPDGQEAEYIHAYYEYTPSNLQKFYHIRKEIWKPSSVAFLYLLPLPLHEYLQVRGWAPHHIAFRYVQLSQHLLQQYSQLPYGGIVWLFLGSFYYVLFAGEMLAFVNKFHAATAEDVLYYVQGLHNLLGIDKTRVHISVAGYSGLKPYVATVFYRFFTNGYKDLSKLYPTPPTLREVGIGMEDILPFTFVGADSAG